MTSVRWQLVSVHLQDFDGELGDGCHVTAARPVAATVWPADLIVVWFRMDQGDQAVYWGMRALSQLLDVVTFVVSGSRPLITAAVFDSLDRRQNQARLDLAISRNYHTDVYSGRGLVCEPLSTALSLLC